VIVSIMGGDVLPEQGYRGVNAVLGKRLLDHAACITSKSAFLDRALARIGDYQGKIRRVTWGVDLDRFRPDRDVTRLRDRLAIPQGHLVFFDPRMATAFYNKHVILGAFSRFVKLRRAAAVLVIAELFPDSAYVAALRRQSRELGVDENVRFVGHVPHEDMADYYALADVTISVPRSDGLPQTIYEALACGSFLVVGDLVQYRELVEDRATAYLVPVGDESALTSALDWVATHRDVRDRAAPLGRRLVEIHADRRIQEEVVTGIYGELLDRRTLREGATSESRRQDSFSR
jgi:glycosyltransferase involved in cell wall biosynthesis